MATASLGRLTLDLVARTASFSEPLSKAERQARNSGKGIAESMDVASIAVKGLSLAVGGLSVAGMVAYSEKVINAGNDIQRFSKLANASVSQFQYYAKGAETAGISIESFADKMKDMQDRIGDFQQTGGGPLADFFTNIAPRIGVTIQQFQKLSGPEALQLFYNSLEKAGASTNDMKFYMEQIISDSSLLIPLLEKNGQGFKKWGDAAQKTGAIMSDDMIKSLAQAKEHLQMMDLQWQGLQANLVNNAIPIIQAIAENWDKVEAGATALATVVGVRLAAAFGIAGAQAAASLIQYTRYQVALARMAGETITLTTVTRGLGGAMLSLVGGPLGLIALGVQVAIAGGTYYAMTRKTEDATDAFDMQGKSISELVDHYNSLSQAKQRAFAYDAAKDLQADTEAYEAAKNQVATYASSIAETVLKQGESADQIRAWRQEFLQGGISAEELANRIGSLSDVTDVYNANMVKYSSAATDAKAKLDAQKSVVSSLKVATDEANNSQREQTKLVNESAGAWEKLTQKQREYITQLRKDASRDLYIKSLVGRGMGVDKANALADAQSSANGENAFKVGLPQAVVDATMKNFNLKNYSFNKSELAAIAKVQGIAKANNFAQIEGLYGLPAGTLAALVLKESSGNANAISPTGAKGLFQTTSIFRKQYGLNSNSSVEAQATAAAKDLAKQRAEFGSDAYALMAYNAGAEGLRTYLKGGLSDSKRKEVAGYVPSYQKWFAGVNGKSSVDNSILMPTQADILAQQTLAAQAQKDLDDKRKEIDAQYYTDAEKLAKDHQDRIEKITQAYTGTAELKSRLAQEGALYKEQSTQLKVQREEDYANLTAFETDRVKQLEDYYARQIELAKTSTKINEQERAKEISGLQRKRDFEIAAVRREQDEQVQSAFEAYLNETEIVVKRYQREREEILANGELLDENRKKLLQANQMNQFQIMNQASNNVFQYGNNAAESLMQRLNPEAFSRYSLQNQYSSDIGGLNSSYNDQVSGINAKADSSSLLDSENTRNAELLAAREQFLQSRKALEDKYAQDERDLDQQQFETKMQVYSQIAGMIGQTFDQMTAMLKDSVGESNALYKTMFMAGKAASIAQAIVNTEEGATKALAQGGAYGSLLAGVIRATGYASVGIMAAQTITGMAHNGIDSIPKEGTWLLDGGERVLNPQQNQDLTRYLNERQSSNEGDVTIQVNVTDSGVTTSGGNTQDQKLLGQMIGNVVRTVIRQEQRQGGLLSK
ncbi:replication protein [Acinetobacter ursingii]|uniref:transglycosylase SLT domain-containing protein n=3 Tax=Acinetobacter ursingii TaxID=108980 RepID=UPI000F7B44FD|nr:transglycosylase SLT domain-containing protein [Acinetobacter ursingii]RSO82928.1 replication protein [Acinetobacter ursingii]